MDCPIAHSERSASASKLVYMIARILFNWLFAKYEKQQDVALAMVAKSFF